MPLGKPTPDGEIIQGSRHYAGRTLGEATIWKCPACGKQNEGRKPEQGCALCGAGDPGKSQVGKPMTAVAQLGEQQESLKTPVAGPVEASRVGRRFDSGSPSTPTQPIRVLRLIEYLIHPGQDVDGTLRRSLVGRIEMAWGTLTATIIDSTDMRQEDLLGMARKQPGVWLANPEAMRSTHTPASSASPAFQAVRQLMKDGLETHERLFLEGDRQLMEMPDTGHAFSRSDATFAKMIEETYGFRLCNTLALALGNLAEELRGNTEPEKFLSTEECLSLANALMQQIPADWQGEGVEAPAPAPVDEAERTRRAEIQARLGAKPEPVYKEPPTEETT